MFEPLSDIDIVGGVTKSEYTVLRREYRMLQKQLTDQLRQNVMQAAIAIHSAKWSQNNEDVVIRPDLKIQQVPDIEHSVKEAVAIIEAAEKELKNDVE